MKYFFLFIPVLFVFSCNNSTPQNTSDKLQDSINLANKKAHEDSLFLNKYPLITWTRKSPVEIGCMLQTEFGFRDSVFNCDNKNYVNKGDPCKKTKEYYEGIIFPDSLATRVHLSIKNIALNFEHGSLQEITVTFKDSLLKTDIQKMFHLPGDKNLPENVMEINYGDDISAADKPVNENYTRWLIITGFDHMGAGDVDCD